MPVLSFEISSSCKLSRNGVELLYEFLSKTDELPKVL